jgi:hypothetical protein
MFWRRAVRQDTFGKMAQAMYIVPNHPKSYSTNRVFFPKLSRMTNTLFFIRIRVTFGEISSRA